MEMFAALKLHPLPTSRELDKDLWAGPTSSSPHTEHGSLADEHILSRLELIRRTVLFVGASAPLLYQNVNPRKANTTYAMKGDHGSKSPGARKHQMYEVWIQVSEWARNSLALSRALQCLLMKDTRL